jgi:hypothetical protein
VAIRSLAGSLPRATLISCIRKWQVALPQRTLTAVKTTGFTGLDEDCGRFATGGDNRACDPWVALASGFFPH